MYNFYKMKNIKNIILVFLLLVNIGLYAEGIPARPYPPRLVNDFCKILSTDEAQQLENELVIFDDSTGVQVTVVTVEDFGEYTKAEYADILGEQWGVGRKKLNNGVIILIKPTGSKNEREVHIAVGYGLESVLPDAICKRIVENEFIPDFKNGNYYAGLTKGIKIIKELAQGEYPPEAYKKKTDKSPFMSLLPIIFIIIIFVLFSRSRNSGSTMGGAGSTIFWTSMMMGGGRSNNSGGGWGNFSGGGGSFGGFGGGSFGGGGAGGSW